MVNHKQITCLGAQDDPRANCLRENHLLQQKPGLLRPGNNINDPLYDRKVDGWGLQHGMVQGVTLNPLLVTERLPSVAVSWYPRPGEETLRSVKVAIPANAVTDVVPLKVPEARNGTTRDISTCPVAGFPN